MLEISLDTSWQLIDIDAVTRVNRWDIAINGKWHLPILSVFPLRFNDRKTLAMTDEHIHGLSSTSHVLD